MKIGIIGLGLIGGSLAKAYKRHDDICVLAYDNDEVILDFAKISGDIDDKLTEEDVAECDLILVSTYPEAAEEHLRRLAPGLNKDTIVIDCLGTKRSICRTGFSLAEEYGFIFAGGHPMAGTHNSGFRYSREDLFDGATMVIIPPATDDIELLARIKELLTPAGFSEFSFTTADEHDSIIAFTSQLAHVVSNAYIKSPSASAHKGFSAGSYKDLTRVAWLNPQMWAELFLDNRDNLKAELDTLIDNLTSYAKAIEAGDKETLISLLEEGRDIKKNVDGVQG